MKKRRNGRAGPGATEPRLDSDFLASSQPVQSDSPTLRLPRLHPELYNAHNQVVYAYGLRPHYMGICFGPCYVPLQKYLVRTWLGGGRLRAGRAGKYGRVCAWAEVHKGKLAQVAFSPSCKSSLPCPPSTVPRPQRSQQWMTVRPQHPPPPPRQPVFCLSRLFVRHVRHTDPPVGTPRASCVSGHSPTSLQHSALDRRECQRFLFSPLLSPVG